MVSMRTRADVHPPLQLWKRTPLNVTQVLIADFFLVLFLLAWLGAGVAQAGFSGGNSPLLDVWYPLWPVLGQPAIGLLMAGALVSGGIDWISKKQEGN